MSDTYEQLEKTVYRELYDGGATFDREHVVPRVINAVIDALVDDITSIDRIALTPMKDVTDESFCHLTRSGLFGPMLTRADLVTYLRRTATNGDITRAQ